ncbi:MAG TPA: hypothetical protein VKB25_03340 [Conexibacter sp.]|nr:hypothetical protein [Conexibacter sp.]
MTSRSAIVVLASELPDPGQLSFAPLMGAVGLFIGGLLGHLRGVSDDERSRLTNVGTWSGIGFGLVVWFLGFAIHPL